MSSDNSQNQVTEPSAIAQDLVGAVKSGKVILPFSKRRLPYGWQPARRQIAFFDLSGYESIGEYSPLDQVITVQCGIKLNVLRQFLLTNKQWFPVAYEDEQTSLLDLILTGNAGPTEIFSGGLRGHILGLTFLLSNGHFAKSGGRVVKNVSGYDLTRFFIGSYGHFALPIEANLRLCSKPEQTYTICVSSEDIERLFSATRSILSYRISLAYIDLLDSRLLPEELTKLILEKSTNMGGQNYCLFAKIYGDNNTAEAEMGIVKEILNESGFEPVIFAEDNEQNRLLATLSNIDGCLGAKTEYRHVVEVALSSGNFPKICRNKDLISFPFLYRPGAGRLVYCLNSLSDQDLLLALLGEYAKKEGTALTVAYSNHNYMKKMTTLGDVADGAETIKAIKQSLKEQFDPANSFNPFVDL